MFEGEVNAKALGQIAALIAAAAALMTGCGGGNGGDQTATQRAGGTSATGTEPSTAGRQPPATTDQPRPNPHRKVKQPRRGSSSKEPLKVTHSYTCNGKPLKALSAAGPVKVDPEIVKPGQPFTVTITDKSVKVAVVTLTGVAARPIQVEGHEQNGLVTAHLTMPGYASCGNKLLEVEGDLSAEAYVGVAR